MLIATPRLSLRPPSPGDADVVFRLHRDPLACAHNPSDMVVDRDEAVSRCRQWMAHWERHGFGYWAVVSDGSVVGFCGVKVAWLHESPVLNLFYRFDPAVWGRGLASEAATAVVAWAASAGPPVIARVRPGNVASARVAVRAGLHRAPHLDAMGEDGPDWVFTSGIESGS